MKERRNQLCHPQHRKPELLATAPKQVCSLDIARLLGRAKRTYFRSTSSWTFSSYVVGWMVAARATAELAKRLIADSCEKQGIDVALLEHALALPRSLRSPWAILTAGYARSNNSHL